MTITSAECPPPFEKVKEYALQGEMIKPGLWANRFEANLDGQRIHFHLVYLDQDKSVCIGVAIEGGYRIFCWSPEYGCLEYLGFGNFIPMNDQDASEEVYKIFRTMVFLNLL